MFFNILKRDLKRKKTMNLILLLFALLASMFVSSGVNNVVTVMNGTDYFFRKASLGDYMIISRSDSSSVQNILDASENVQGYRTEQLLFVDKDKVMGNGKKLKAKSNVMLAQPLTNEGIRYFQKDDQVLTKVEKGKIYLTAGFLKKNDLKVGDEFRITLGSVSKSFKIAGEIKDAFLGSDMMGNVRLLMDEEDYEEFLKDKGNSVYAGKVFYIDSDHTKALASELTEANGIMFDGDRQVVKMTYVMDMIVAMIVLVLSVCLIIVSFAILKFVITFTISEEFREIGVMKAIGLKDSKIRRLYLTKYFALSVAGGLAGLGFGFPFGRLLIRSVSEKMLLGNDQGNWLNLIGTVAVILLMTGFAYLCTGKVKKYTPVDAIRSGQTGERFRKKSIYHLGKAHTGSPMFMAINDVLSAPGRFLTIILTFFLCSVFVFGVVLCVDTMNSKELITLFGKEADVYITDSKLVKMEMISEKGDEMLESQCQKLEKELAEAGMPAKVSMDVWYKYTLTFEGNQYQFTFQQNKKQKASDYRYTRGTPPQNADEIAITEMVSEELGAKIGDIVTIDFGEEKRECMVTAYFQTMNQLGKVIRLHEEAPASLKYGSALMSFMLEFEDAPDGKEIHQRIEKIRKMYEITGVFDAAGYCADCIGVVGTMKMVSRLLLVITGIVVVLVTILMERSFLSDERVQIALLKAIGFKNRTLIKWQVFRFMIVAVLAEMLAVLLTRPVTRLWCDPIWQMMGANDIRYYFNPLTLLLVYPGVLLLLTLLTAWVMSLLIRKISSRDIANIE